MRYSVAIKPNSRKGPLVERQNEDLLTVYVREPAADGKANTALVILLAEYFDVPKTRITIVRGHTSRQKVIDIKEI